MAGEMLLPGSCEVTHTHTNSLFCLTAHTRTNTHSATGVRWGEVTRDLTFNPNPSDRMNQLFINTGREEE